MRISDWSSDVCSSDLKKVCFWGRFLAARVFNEVWRSNLIQLAVTFHGGMEAISWVWVSGIHAHNCGMLAIDSHACTCRDQMQNSGKSFSSCEQRHLARSICSRSAWPSSSTSCWENGLGDSVSDRPNEQFGVTCSRRHGGMG